MDLIYIDVSINSLRTFTVEMGDNVCTGAHMEFDLINLCKLCKFPHRTDLEWTFPSVKNNSKSIDIVVFPHTFTHGMIPY